MKYEKLNKKALTCMYVQTIIRFVFVTGIIIVLDTLCREDWPPYVSLILYGVIGLFFLYLLIAPKVRYERYRYILNQEELEVRKGLIIINTEIVPIERLHKIEVSSGPILRAFGLKEVVATTAGSNIIVSYLDDEVAEAIAQHLKKRINTIVVEERNADTEAAAMKEEQSGEAVPALEEMMMEGKDESK